MTRYEWSTLALWVIAAAATLLLAGKASAFTYLGPVFAICMIGALTVVRRAREK